MRSEPGVWRVSVASTDVCFERSNALRHTTFVHPSSAHASTVPLPGAFATDTFTTAVSPGR